MFLTNRRLRFRLNTQVLVFALVLISIPWLSYRFVAETRVFMIEGQTQAQEQLARGIVTLFQGRDDLLAELPYLDSQQVVFSHPLLGQATVDGYTNEWLDFQLFANHFGAGEESEDGYSLLLGEKDDRIFGLVRIQDNKTVLKTKGAATLDLSDHLRLSLPDRNGNERRLVIVATNAGAMEVWYVKEDWATPQYRSPSSSFIIQAVMRPLVDGYLVEFALPKYFLNQRQEFGLAVADVDSEDGTMRHLKTLVGADTTIESHFNLLAMRAPEANKILSSLSRSDSQIVIYDNNLQVRASVGQVSPPKSEQVKPEDFLEGIQSWLNQGLDWFIAIPDYLNPVQAASQERDLLNRALDKKFASGRWHKSAAEQVFAVAAPILDQEGELLGVVLIKQSTAQILGLQRQAMENIALLSLSTMLVILLVLLLFSWRQAMRIRRLGREAQQVVDPDGRLRTDQLYNEIRAGDEIGDLARSFSGVVARLHEHQEFMSTMPRTLRHEVNNPLNATMTSLENMQMHGVSEGQQRYIDSAQRGLVKISAIVEKLADAANLEAALHEDELEPLDLLHLLKTYVHHQNPATLGGSADVVFEANQQSIYVAGVDYRIEQLLDKLLDNARDFRDEASLVTVRLFQQDYDCFLEVENNGPSIPSELMAGMFNSMVSARAAGAGHAHFGLGLYIVRLISQFHGGSVSAHNLIQPEGVMFRVKLPILLV
ncbi:MAG: two-component system sensor histidine kinase ChvG [Candidatus Paceibacteria bacterium]|jgi:two-component system sensor histidine kinase ChvG|tara:strand:- start:8043 stop:10175 length:2133 start_codon:yes stop_codon:yes gene_type:complete